MPFPAYHLGPRIELRLEFAGECICFPFKFPGEGVHENLDKRFEGGEDHLAVPYVICQHACGGAKENETQT